MHLHTINIKKMCRFAFNDWHKYLKRFDRLNQSPTNNLLVLPMNTTMKVVSGVLVGAVIGAGLALLVAPAAGDKTRNLIKNKSKKYSKQAIEAVSAYIDNLKRNYSEQQVPEEGNSSIDLSNESVNVKGIS
jgi:gas vesicle protein